MWQLVPLARTLCIKPIVAGGSLSQKVIFTFQPNQAERIWLASCSGAGLNANRKGADTFVSQSCRQSFPVKPHVSYQAKLPHFKISVDLGFQEVPFRNAWVDKHWEETTKRIEETMTSQTCRLLLTLELFRSSSRRLGPSSTPSCNINLTCSGPS